LIVDSGACLLKSEGELWVVSQPEESLGSCNLAPERMILRAVDQFIEFVGFEGSSRLINKRGDIILDSFWDILNFLFLKDPFLVVLSFLEVKP
jgi:hypothetical protein